MMEQASTALYKLPNEIMVDDMVLPGDYITSEVIHKVNKMKPKEGDVLVASYPRSGSTWMLEAISLIQNNGDAEAVSSKLLFHRAPYLEHKQSDPTKEPNNVTLAENMHPSEGRLLKTHLPFGYVSNLVRSELVKTVVVMRNPKDMLVSLYHFYHLNKVLGSFQGDWTEFFELFKCRRLVYGDWLDHITSYWKNCAQIENVLFVKYEDAKEDILTTLRRIAQFLNKKLDDETLQIIADHVHFSKMKKNPMTNYEQVAQAGVFREDAFLRRGATGDWKNYFTKEQSSFVDDLYVTAAEQMGLPFKDHL